MDRYNSLSDVQNGLLAKRIIDISEEINGDMAAYVREALIRLTIDGNPDIKLRITSTGGGCLPGFVIYDLLGQYPGQITGVVFGFANSMALIILQACDIRQATEHSKICLHYTINNNTTRKQRKIPKEIDKFNKKTDDYDEKLIRVYMSRTQKTRKQIHQLLWDEAELSAEEALDLGFIDEIIKPVKKRMVKK